MFLRQVPMNEKFVSGDTTYTRVGADQIKDENGVVTKMNKNTVVQLENIVKETLFTDSQNLWTKEDTNIKDVDDD